MTRSRYVNFYVRIGNCDRQSLVRLMETAKQLGSIRDSGHGTAKDPNSAWFEIRAKDWIVSIEALRQNLSMIGIDNSIIPEVIVVDPGEGRTQSRQLDLFGGGA